MVSAYWELHDGIYHKMKVRKWKGSDPPLLRFTKYLMLFMCVCILTLRAYNSLSCFAAHPCIRRGCRVPAGQGRDPTKPSSSLGLSQVRQYTAHQWEIDSTILWNWKTARVHLLLLLSFVAVAVVVFHHFSESNHSDFEWHATSPTQHRSTIMGKSNLHVKVGKEHEVQSSQHDPELEAGLWRMKMSRDEAGLWSAPMQSRICFFHHHHQGQDLAGQVKNGALWNWLEKLQFALYPYLPCFSYVLLVTLKWHIKFYFILWFSGHDLITQKIAKSFMSNQMAMWLTHPQAF